MAKPQLEKGYTRIANEILEALGRIRISGEATQVLNVILRKTYGFGKKQDRISLSQFILATGMKKPTVCRAINKLLSMEIIIKIDNELGEIYCIQKDFDEWKPLAKKITLAKKIITVIKKDNSSLSKKIHTKETTTKETLTKERSGTSPLIPDVIKLFEGVNPACKKYYANTVQRQACQDLIETYSFEEVCKVIAILPKTNKIAYFPTINTPVQLWNDYQKLKDRLVQEKSKLSVKNATVAFT